MNLDELLNVLPGLRRLRGLDAAMLRVLLDRQKGECTWCGDKIGKGRQTWCGKVCVDAFKMRCCQSTVRAFVEKRDQGICQACGRDTLAAEEEAKSKRLMVYITGRPYETKEQFEARKEVQVAELAALGYARGRWREVDHNPPVVEYGGLCEVTSLRLLCGTCHAQETALLARRRSCSKV